MCGWWGINCGVCISTSWLEPQRGRRVKLFVFIVGQTQSFLIDNLHPSTHILLPWDGDENELSWAEVNNMVARELVLYQLPPTCVSLGNIIIPNLPCPEMVTLWSDSCEQQYMFHKMLPQNQFPFDVPWHRIGMGIILSVFCKHEIPRLLFFTPTTYVLCQIWVPYFKPLLYSYKYIYRGWEIHSSSPPSPPTHNHRL